MTRRQKAPLRPLSSQEQGLLQRIARSGSERAEGASFSEAALAAGRKSGDAVAHLLERFNQEGPAGRPSRRGPTPWGRPTPKVPGPDAGTYHKGVPPWPGAHRLLHNLPQADAGRTGTGMRMPSCWSSTSRQWECGSSGIISKDI